MGGCSNCAGKSGCDHRKGAMFEALDGWMARLYPTKTWGEIDAELAMVSGKSADDAMYLAEELSTELKGATVFVPGSDEDLCDYIYVLCKGREPCAMQLHAGGVAVPEELESVDFLSESYLRVALSAVAPLAVVQQARVDLRKVDGQWLVEEHLAAGVYDAPLLKRFQRLVALLPAYELSHLDMGELCTPPEGFDSRLYSEQFGRPAETVNYLFYREPSATQKIAPLASSAEPLLAT